MGYGSARAFMEAGRSIRDIGSLAGGLRRERAEDERLEAERKQTLTRQRMSDEMALGDRGGGFGPPPATVTESMPTSGPNRRPDFTKGGLSPYEKTETVDADRYRTGGEGEDAYYYEEPGYRRDRLAEEETARATREREAMMGRMTPAFDAVMGGKGTGSDMSTLVAEGVNSPRLYAPEPATPEEKPWSADTDEVIQRRIWDRDHPEDAAAKTVDRGSTGWQRMSTRVANDTRFMNLPLEEQHSIADRMMLGTYETPEVVEPVAEEGGPSMFRRAWDTVTGAFNSGGGGIGDVATGDKGESIVGGRYGITRRRPTPVGTTPNVGPDASAPSPPGTLMGPDNVPMADQPVLDAGAEEYRGEGGRQAVIAAMRQDEWNQDEIDYMVALLFDEQGGSIAPASPRRFP